MTNMNTNTLEVCVPDIGGTVDVEVIEVLVKVGDVVTKEQSLVTLEGDKATMEIPSPAQGVVEKIVMKVGDRVAQGALILVMSGVDEEKGRPQATIPEPLKDIVPEVVVEPVKAQKPEPVQSLEMGSESFIIGAGPSVRRMARELGVNLADVHGTGRKSRISKDDLTTFVKQIVQEKTSTGGLSIPSPVAIDFSQWGAIEVKPLNKIKRLTGVNVHRSWVTIPHVTQFDEADITALEQFRKAEKTDGYKLTLLAFVCKVVVQALKRYPEFNASLDPTSQNLIYKQYFNIGIAVETPHGLVVPVMKAVDTLSVGEIAQEMARLSTKAREKGLPLADMSGGCFTISSLGGIGGTAFTPIVNGPEVAILGLSRALMKPVYLEGEFKPRLMLPLSLSYDHRVIDGAEAARFARYLCDLLSDIRRILL